MSEALIERERERDRDRDRDRETQTQTQTQTDRQTDNQTDRQTDRQRLYFYVKKLVANREEAMYIKNNPNYSESFL